MSNWVHKLELGDLWKKREDDEMSIEELGREVGKRLHITARLVPKKFEDELESLAQEFEDVDGDVEEFDYILGRLYDVADSCLPTPSGQMQRKLLWVNTFR